MNTTSGLPNPDPNPNPNPNPDSNPNPNPNLAARRVLEHDKRFAVAPILTAPRLVVILGGRVGVRVRVRVRVRVGVRVRVRVRVSDHGL